jgi:hypothetical protein
MRPILSIDDINARPYRELRFRDFRDLRSGHDQYSRRTLAELRAQLGEDTYAIIERECEGVIETITVALRWCARGLEATRAARKAKCDAEVSANARAVAIDARYYPPDHR